LSILKFSQQLIYERQATLQDMEADLRSARASTRRYNTALGQVLRWNMDTNPAVRSMYLALQRRRDEALLRELQEQGNYGIAAFESAELAVLTNFSSVAEATNAMMRLSRVGIQTQIRSADAGTGKLPRSFHLVVRQVDELRARQALPGLLVEDRGADHQN